MSTIIPGSLSLPRFREENHFSDEPADALVRNPVLDELRQPFAVDGYSGIGALTLCPMLNILLSS